MDEAASSGGEAVGVTSRSSEEIRNDIEHTREDLGDTVEALAAKTDVKAQAQAKLEDVKQQARSRVDDVKQRVETARAGAEERTPPTARDSAQKLRGVATANPVPAAAIGGFVGGLVVGRFTRRR